MDNQRLILFLALSMILMLLWQSWQVDYAPKPLPPETISNITGAKTEPSLLSSSIPEIVDQPSPSVDFAPSTSGRPEIIDEQVLTSDQRIIVTTDILQVEIDSIGGDLRRAFLLAYPVSSDKKDIPFRIMNDTLPSLFVAQSGLISKSSPVPNHHDKFLAERQSYQLAAGSDSLQVPLYWQGPDGLIVEKIYTFYRDSYLIDVSFNIQNKSQKEWKGHIYHQLQRTENTGVEQSRFIYTYTGGVISTLENKYQKIDFSDMVDWKADADYSKGGWVAMLQHYFIGAWIPQENQFNHFYTSTQKNGRYILGFSSGEVSINTGGTEVFTTKLYVGPKEPERLKEAAPNLQLTVDYGVLTIISEPLFWLLNKLHSLLGNWGWAIIGVTLLIKLAFYKLSEASYKSMARMRQFQPRIASLKEKFGSDKQKMSKAMMDLYKKEKINPLGGCLPMIVQIPVFIALYWVLLESVGLRQADFMLWIHDLSAKDPYFVLPLLMGATMLIQQKISPAPLDPIQQKVMMMLPVVFTVFFAFFPSGLVLYWLVNNILSISQQWYITNKITKATDKNRQIKKNTT